MTDGGTRQANGLHPNLVPTAPGEIRNPKGINQHSKGKSLRQCAINAGQEMHDTVDGRKLPYNEVFVSGLKRICHEFLSNYREIHKKDAWKYELAMRMWKDLVAPGDGGGLLSQGTERSVVTVLISKEKPIEVVDVKNLADDDE